jgi:hypothetical protein
MDRGTRMDFTAFHVDCPVQRVVPVSLPVRRHRAHGSAFPDG